MLEDLRKQLNEDVKIDPRELDVECSRQAELFCFWAEQAINHRRIVEDLELEQKRVDAQAELSIREKPLKYGIKNPTEGAIKARAAVHKAKIRHAQKVNAARSKLMFFEKVAVPAMDTRKRMLDDMVTLHGQQYFAGPTAPRNLVQIYKAAKAKRRERVLARQAETVKVLGDHAGAED